MKINIDEVESVLLQKKIEPTKVNEIIRELEEIAQEVAEEAAKEEGAVDADGLPTDVGADALPKIKWETVIVLNDKEGYLKDKEIAGWVVQQEENADAGLVLSKLADAAKTQNTSGKRKKSKGIISNYVELFESLKSKFAKQKKLRIKTKDLTRVIVTDGKFSNGTIQTDKE
jgi:hypothetical protein